MRLTCPNCHYEYNDEQKHRKQGKFMAFNYPKLVYLGKSKFMCSICYNYFEL